MRDYIEKACEEIDAAIFSGDAFEDQGERKALAVYLGRWSRSLEEFEQPDETQTAASPEVEIEKACEEIDAQIFSGDAFEDQGTRQAMLVNLGRWTDELSRKEDRAKVVAALNKAKATFPF